MASVLVPPGGFRGFAQMTQSSQNILSRGVRGGQAARRTRPKGKLKKFKVKKKPRYTRKADGSVAKYRKPRKSRLIKGSAAAKAYMAKIRRKRK